MNQTSSGLPAVAEADLPPALRSLLARVGVSTRTYAHRAVFTVAESAPVKAGLPGAHTKNLFLRDRKGALFLVTAKDDTAIDLKRLHEAVGASGRLSFGSADLLRELLGVEPGSVTPFGVLNDVAGRVRVVLDDRLSRHDLVNVHPLRNDMTTAIAFPDLVAVLRATSHDPRVLALPAPPGDCVAPPPAPF